MPTESKTTDRAFPSLRVAVVSGRISVTLIDSITYRLTEADALALQGALDQARFDLASERVSDAIRSATSRSIAGYAVKIKP